MPKKEATVVVGPSAIPIHRHEGRLFPCSQPQKGVPKVKLLGNIIPKNPPWQLHIPNAGILPDLEFFWGFHKFRQNFLAIEMQIPS